MASLKDFLTTLAKKAGYDLTAQQAFFDALPDTEVPAEVTVGVDTRLISLSDAKNNHPEIKNHYTKQALDGVDSTITSLFDEMQVPDDVRAEILAERSSFKRIPLLTKKIAELQEKKSGAAAPDKAAIQKEIDGLHATIRAEKEARKADQENYGKQLTGFKVNAKLESLLSGHKTTADELDPETRAALLQQVLNKHLQDNQAQFVIDDNGNFVVRKLDGTNLFGENNQQITPAQFIESTLAKTKLLKVSQAPAATPPNANGSYSAPRNGSGKDEKNPNAAVMNLNAKALRDLEQSGTANPMV